MKLKLFFVYVRVTAGRWPGTESDDLREAVSLYPSDIDDADVAILRQDGKAPVYRT